MKKEYRKVYDMLQKRYDEFNEEIESLLNEPKVNHKKIDRLFEREFELLEIKDEILRLSVKDCFYEEDK